MNKPRVLVAEKDGPLRDVFQIALTVRGYEALVAADAQECLEKLQTMRPDVLMLDRELPQARESGLVEQFRNGSAARQVPIVLLAGQGSPGMLARLVVSPVIACLQKPFKFSYLLEVLASAGAPPAPPQRPSVLPGRAGASETSDGQAGAAATRFARAGHSFCDLGPAARGGT
jgi:CheY-like chemotaxis protein